MNPNILRARIVECGFAQTQVAKAVGMAANTFCRKLNGNGDFKLSEARRLVRVLHIKDPVRVFDLGVEEEEDMGHGNKHDAAGATNG